MGSDATPPAPSREIQLRRAAAIGMASALFGSSLLLLSTFLDHVVADVPGFSADGERPGASLWDLQGFDGSSSSGVSIPIVLAILINSAYFATQTRQIQSLGPLVQPAVAFLALVVNVIVVFQVAGASTRYDEEIAFLLGPVDRGAGFSMMIVAGIFMVLGSLVAFGSLLGVVTPQVTASSTSSAPAATAETAPRRHRHRDRPAPTSPPDWSRSSLSSTKVTSLPKSSRPASAPSSTRSNFPPFPRSREHDRRARVAYGLAPYLFVAQLDLMRVEESSLRNLSADGAHVFGALVAVGAQNFALRAV
jgi:hypothetical protein